MPFPEQIDSEFNRLNKAAFIEILDRVGVDITSSYGNIMKCISSPIKFESSLELVGQVTQSSVQITMLADDFTAAFEPFDPVILNSGICMLQGQTMTIVRIDRDPQDPTVTFYAIGRH